DRARQNLGLVLEGRPLIPYPQTAHRALQRILPVLLDALWQSPDPDEALNQFERFVSAIGPRTAYLELLASRYDVLTNLVKLCARGELVTELLVLQPERVAALASPATFATSKRKRTFRAGLGDVLVPDSPRAQRADQLRRWKQGEELGIVWRMLLGVTDAHGL